MKTQKVSGEGHGLKKGQVTEIEGKRVVITRTVKDAFWYRKETLVDKFLRAARSVQKACQRPRVVSKDK